VRIYYLLDRRRSARSGERPEGAKPSAREARRAASGLRSLAARLPRLGRREAAV